MKNKILFLTVCWLGLVTQALGQDYDTNTGDDTTANIMSREDIPVLRLGLNIGYCFHDVWAQGYSDNDVRPDKRYVEQLPKHYELDYPDGYLIWVGAIAQYSIAGNFSLFSSFRFGLERIRGQYNEDSRYGQTYQGSYGVYDIKTAINRYHFQVPLLLKFTSKGTKGFSLAAGPYLNFVAGNYYTYEEHYTHYQQGEVVDHRAWGYSDTESNHLNRFTYGLQFEIGHEFQNGLGLKFILLRALRETYVVETDEYDSRFGISLTYFIPSLEIKKKVDTATQAPVVDEKPD